MISGKATIQLCAAFWVCVVGARECAAAPTLQDLVVSRGAQSPVVYRMVARAVVKHHMMEVVISSDGRFLEIRRESEDDASPDAELSLTHAVAFDGTTIFATRSHQAQYTASGVADSYVAEPPGPIQWMYMPSVVAPVYAEWLLASKDLEQSAESGTSRAKSVACGFSMAWDERGRVVTIERTLERGDAFRVTHTYDARASSEAGPIAFDVEVLRAGQTVSVTSWEVELLAETDEPALAFDPVKLDLARLDTQTGDVVHPVHGFMYNQYKVDAVAGGGGWRRYARAAAAAGIVLLVAVAIRSAARARAHAGG